MALTPRNIWTPDSGDAYAPTTDMAAMADSIDDAIGDIADANIPIGGSIGWYLSVDPVTSGGGVEYMIPDGRAISRSTYSELFALLGTVWGAGDGTTTFNIPNEKGRVVIGRDAGQAEFDSLGEVGGAKAHTHGLSTAVAAIGVGYWAVRSAISPWTATNSNGLTAPGGNSSSYTNGAAIVGSTDSASNLPPYVVRNSAMRVK